MSNETERIRKKRQFRVIFFPPHSISFPAIILCVCVFTVGDRKLFRKFICRQMRNDKDFAIFLNMQRNFSYIDFLPLPSYRALCLLHTREHSRNSLVFTFSFIIPQVIQEIEEGNIKKY